MRLLALALAVAAIAVPVQAQQTTVQCVCTSGCKIASDPMPPNVAGFPPLLCTVYQMPGRVKLGSAAPVDATSAGGGIASNNASVCLPSSSYLYGPTGSLACLVPIPAQPEGTNLTVVMTATNSVKESADSTAHTFQSVSSVSGPQVPVIWGVAR